MVATLKAKAANPFRDGPALLRAARADAFFPEMFKIIQDLLQTQWNMSAIRVANLQSPFDVGTLAIWDQQFKDEEGPLIFLMTKAGFSDALTEFDQGRSLTRRLKGKQEELVENLLVAQDSDEFFTFANFDRIDQHLEEVASSQTRTNAKGIQKVFDDAVGEGLTPRQIARKISAAGIEKSVPRARMIARTETIWSYNEGAMLRYEEQGVSLKEWVVTQDDLLCPWCTPMDGRVVETSSNFFDAGTSTFGLFDGVSRSLNFGTDVAHPPLHPNCRCVLVPVLEPEVNIVTIPT